MDGIMYRSTTHTMHPKCFELFEKVYKTFLGHSFPGIRSILNESATTLSSFTEQERLKNEIELENGQLKEIFSLMTAVWCETSQTTISHSSSGDWALEKLREGFMQIVGTAEGDETVKKVHMDDALKQLWEGNKLVMYPDYLMNDFSLMAADLLVTQPNLSQQFRNLAFKTIRSPLEFMMANKGHRVDVVFKIYRRFIEASMALDLLNNVDFDVETALTFSVASPQNYTRKSALHYVCSLIKFAFDTRHNVQLQNKMKKTIVVSINKMLCRFEEKLVLMHETDTFTVSNMCVVLSTCCSASSLFRDEMMKQETCQHFTQLLTVCANDTNFRDLEILLPCVGTLVDIIEAKSVHLKPQRLLDVFWYFCRRKDTSISSELLLLASNINKSLGPHHPDSRCLLSVSLLPLMLACGVPLACQEACPLLVQCVESILLIGPASKRSKLIQRAVENVFKLIETKNVLAEYKDMIDYMILKTKRPPANATKPLISKISRSSDDEVTSNVALVTIISVLNYWNQKPDLKSSDADIYIHNIHEYILAVLHYPDLDYKQINCVLQCYISSLGRLLQIEKLTTTDLANPDIASTVRTSTVAAIIHVKLVHMDARVREGAVAAVGGLYCLGSSSVRQILRTSGVLVLMYQSLDDGSEDVVTQTIKVIHQGIMSRSLEKWMADVGDTQIELKTKVLAFLASCRWDNVKPAAFRLMALITSCPEDLVLRAELCLRHDNSVLALTVLEHCRQSLMPKLDDASLSVVQKLFHLRTWLAQGWGDLVVSQVDTQDVSATRAATLILKEVLAFLRKPDHEEVLSETLEEIVDVLSLQGSSSELARRETSFADIFQSLVPLTEEPLVDKLCPDPSELGGPPIKVMKLASPEKKPKTSLCLLCKLTTVVCHKNLQGTYCRYIQQGNNTEDEMMDTIEPHNHCIEPETLSGELDQMYGMMQLNSTKELPLLVLKSEPLPTKKATSLIIDIIIPGILNSELKGMIEGILALYTFRSTLAFLDPDDLHNEALRSTDEYSRRPTMILEDLELVVGRTTEELKASCDRQVATLLSKRIMNLCEVPLYLRSEESSESEDSKIPSDDPLSVFVAVISTKTTAVLPVTDTEYNDYRSLLLFILDISCYIEMKEEFVIQILHRERVLVKKPTDEIHGYDSVDMFLSRLRKLKKNDSFNGYLSDDIIQCSEDLEDFLSTFRTCLAILREQQCLNPTPQPDLSNTAQLLSVLFYFIEKNCSVSHYKVLKVCASGTEKEIGAMYKSYPQDLKPFEEFYMKTSKELITFSKSRNCGDILDALLKLSQYLLMAKCRKEPVSLITKISKLAKQIDQWITADDDEFDSDGDNDPTAVDCF